MLKHSNYHLSEIGLRRWRLRADHFTDKEPKNLKPQPQSDDHRLFILGDPCAPVSVLFVSTSGADLNQEESDLLKGILKALKLPSAPIESRSLLVAPSIKAVILLGDVRELLLKPFSAIECFRTHSLSAMLLEPTLKASAWSTLKKALQHILS